MSDSSQHFGSLSWDFSGFELTKLLSASNGDEFVSPIFHAGAFKFQCKIYPNGRKKQQKGCVMLYFILQTSLQTKKIKQITVRARLYCPQTLCDWKHIQHLKKDNAGIGWHCKNMLLSEIENHSYLKFICQISIVRIEYKNNPNNIYHQLSKMNIYSKHEWQINNKLFESFQTAHNGKFYHSTDFNHGCWCSSMAPNGSTVKDVGNVKCGLQLLQLPPFISRIKAQFSITAPMLNIKCHGKKEFNYNSTFIAWSDGTLLTQDLLNISGKKITFVIELVIIKIFDEYNKEIVKSDWLKYGVVHNLNNVQLVDEKSDLSDQNCNFLSPSTTQMSILSPINIATHNNNISHLSYMETNRELKEGNEEEYESEEFELHSMNTNKTAKHYHSRSYSTKISANFELINSQKNAISELAEKLDEIEVYKTEDEKNIILMEQSIINVQKAQNGMQQQQFEQTAMLKQCINELSLTMHRLTNEIAFIKNKMNRIESRVDNQQIQIESMHSSKVNKNKNRRNSNCSNKSNKSKSSTRSNRRSAKKSVGHGVKSRKKEYAINISSGLASWLKHECGFPAYVELFAENGYDSFEIVKEMTRFELDDIGIHLKGHQFKIMREIEKLQNSQKHHRASGGSSGMNHLKMINYLTPVASPAGSDSAQDVNININDYNSTKLPLLTPTHEDHQSTYSHSKLFLHNLNSKTITNTITNTNTNTSTATESSHKHSQSDKGKHIKQITPIHLRFGSNTLSPSLSTSLATSYTTTHSTTNTNGYFQWNQNKKPMLLESPTDFSHNNHNYHNPKVYEARSIKKGYHNQILPQISKMWECKSCHNSNLGTINKCQFCQTQR